MPYRAVFEKESLNQPPEIQPFFEVGRILASVVTAAQTAPPLSNPTRCLTLVHNQPPT